MFIFMPFTTKLVKKHGKKEVAAVGSIVGLLGSAIICIFPLCPLNLQLVVYMIGLVFFGLGLGFYNCVSWAMMGDAIDYQEWKSGKREESVIYALYSFFRKLAQGVGPAVALVIMASLGYVNNAVDPVTGEAFIDVTLLSWDVAVNLRYLVAALFLVSAIMQFVGLGLVYNLDKKTLAKMNEDLAAKRNAE